MKNIPGLRRIAMLLLASLAPAVAQAQISAQASSRLAGDWRTSAPISIGNAAPFSRQGSDQGPAASSQPLGRMLLLLTSSQAQQAALNARLAAITNPAATEYHRWLTPREFAAEFSNSPADVAAVSAWLQSQGFAVAPIPSGRGWIEFSGTVSQIEQAFGVSVHNVAAIGAAPRAVLMGSLSVPAALRPVIAGLVSLDGVLSTASLTPPERLSATASTQAFTPAQAAKLLDLQPLVGKGITGAGQSIAIASRSNLNPSDIDAFRAAFGLSAASLSIMPDGVDPGLASDQPLATLAASWAGAAAPDAKILLVPAATTTATDGLDLSLASIVDGKLATTVAVAYSACEAGMSEAHQAFYSALYRQAAAEGITIVAASGDSGPAACARPALGPVTTGFGVNALASTPWNTVVGVAASDAGNTAAYRAWSQRSESDPAYAGGGGLSTLYTQPTWQPVPASVADAVRGTPTRMMPDLSLPTAFDAASPGLVFCLSASADQNSGCNFMRSGGSGVAASLFAGIAALRTQNFGAQGNLAPTLYQLGGSGIFHDVQMGSAEISCAPGSDGCGTSGQIGFAASAGYDLATGLGVPDAAALVLAQPLAGSTPVFVSNLITPGQIINPSGSVVLSASVGGGGGLDPTGTITFYDASASSNIITIALTPSGGGTSSATQTVTGALAQGSHSIVAQYSGDSTYMVANSAAVIVTAMPSNTDTTVTPGSNTPTAGSSLIVSAVVSSAAAGTGALAPSGSVTFSVDGVSQGSSHLIAGLASGAQTNSSTSYTLTVPYGTGVHNIVGVYSGDINYYNSTSLSTAINVTAGTPAVTLMPSSVTPSTGSNLTLTASIAPPSGASGATAPTGNVTFTLNGVSYGTVAVITGSGSSTATVTITTPTIGSYSAVATYSGDLNYTSSASSAVTLNVGKTATALVVTPATTTPVAGSSLLVSASLTPGAASANTPSGTVTFTLDGLTVDTALLAGGNTATTHITVPLTGSHLLAASYGGDSNFSPSNANSVTLTVAKTTTTTTATPTTLTPALGSTLTVDSIITPTAYVSADPTGTMTYTLDGSMLPVQVVVPGTPSTATISFTVSSAGTHALAAAYSGDTYYSASASSTATLSVAKPTTTLTISPATTTPSDATLLGVNVTVTAAGGGSVPISGIVTLTYDGATIGTANISGVSPSANVVSFVVPTAGTHALGAIYSGDLNFGNSTATPVTLNVSKSTPTVAVIPATSTPAAGSTLQLSAQITPGAVGATPPTGTVSFFIDGNSVGNASVIASSPSTATLSIPAPSVGIHLVTVTYGGDPNYNSASSTAVSINVVKANTTVAVTPASPTPSPNTSMQVTATISATTTGSTVPTGTVSFTMDGTSVGSATVSGGTTAIITITVPATGTHTLQANYSGDSSFNGSTSAIATYTVAKTASSTVVIPATTSPALGATLQVTANVSAATGGSTQPTGSITFTVDGVSAAVQPLIAGIPSTATVTLPAMTPGAHAIAAAYSGDTYYSPSTATAVTVTVPKAGTNMTVIPATTTPPGGSTLAVSASIVPAIFGANLPTGTVSFTLDGTAVATSAVVSGNPATATANINQITPGSHRLAATYSGDAYYAAATAQAVTLTVARSPSTTNITPSTTTPTGGSSLAVTVDVTSISPSTALPTGTVTVAMDGVAQATGTLLAGSPSTVLVTIPMVSAGMHLLTATYTGDTYYTGSNSTTVAVIASKGVTTTTVAATPSTLTAGTAETLTATVAPATLITGVTYTLTGTVSFYDGTKLLGVASVVKNTATLSGLAMAINVNHNITAVYGGDTNWNGSTSGILALAATTAPDFLTLTANYTVSPPGAAVILTAKVTPATSSVGTATPYPSGTVAFYTGTTLVGTATLVAQKDSLDFSSVASLSVTNLPGGVNTLFAIYQGDLNYTVAISNTLNITVQNFAIGPSATNTSANITIVRGTSGAISFDITGYGGYNKQIQVVCQVPTQDNMTCTPSPQLVTAPDTVTFVVQTFLSGAAESHPVPTPMWPRMAGGTALAGLVFFLLPFGRRARTFLRTNASRALVLVLMLVGLAGVGIGCTSTTPLTSNSTGATPLGVATLKVIAQANVDATTVSQSAYFTVNVVTK